MAISPLLAGVYAVDVVTRETGGSGRTEFHNRAFYRKSEGVGALADNMKAFCDAHAALYTTQLTPDLTLDRIVMSTAAEDSDSADATVYSFPYGSIGQNSFGGDPNATTVPLNTVAVLKFGVAGGRGGSKNLRGVLRSMDVTYSRGSIAIVQNRRDSLNNFAQALVSHDAWILVTVRPLASGFAVSDALNGAFSRIGYRQLDRNSTAKISTRTTSLKKRAVRAIREGQLIGASFNVLQALGELTDAAGVAAIINNMEPVLTNNAPQLPGG